MIRLNDSLPDDDDALDEAFPLGDGTADTVDHLLPQSRGGTNTWLNTVAACTRCNNLKANRTPPEAGMRLAFDF